MTTLLSFVFISVTRCARYPSRSPDLVTVPQRMLEYVCISEVNLDTTADPGFLFKPMQRLMTYGPAHEVFSAKRH